MPLKRVIYCLYNIHDICESFIVKFDSLKEIDTYKIHIQNYTNDVNNE